jgi:hypothetical protein
MSMSVFSQAVASPVRAWGTLVLMILVVFVGFVLLAMLRWLRVSRRRLLTRDRECLRQPPPHTDAWVEAGRRLRTESDEAADDEVD